VARTAGGMAKVKLLLSGGRATIGLPAEAGERIAQLIR